MAPAHPRRQLALRIGAVLLIGYGILAYLVLPATWTHYEHQKKLAGVTMVTLTAQSIQGDPINFGLVGAKEDVICAVYAAAWYPADPIILRSKCRNHCVKRRRGHGAGSTASNALIEI